MDSLEHLRLHSSDFESNMKRGLLELRQDEEFFDVTLACGSKQMKAHKVILSACSPFFRSLIKSIPHQHPLIYLRGVQFRHLESILCFMYNGEVNVAYKDLSGVMNVAKELQVMGLIKSVAPPSNPHVQREDNSRVDINLAGISTQAELPPEAIPGTSTIQPEQPTNEQKKTDVQNVTIKEETVLEMSSDNEMENNFECSADSQILGLPEDEHSGLGNSPVSPGFSLNDIEAYPPIAFNDDVRLIKSNRGKDMLVDSNSYTYYRKRENKSKSISFWTCTTTRCPARVHTITLSDQMKVIKCLGTHSHRPTKKVLNKTINQKIMSAALSKPEVSSKNLLNEILSELDMEDVASLPNLECFLRNIRRWRKKKKDTIEEIIP